MAWLPQMQYEHYACCSVLVCRWKLKNRVGQRLSVFLARSEHLSEHRRPSLLSAYCYTTTAVVSIDSILEV
jgi:hypothetical protein